MGRWSGRLKAAIASLVLASLAACGASATAAPASEPAPDQPAPVVSLSAGAPRLTDSAVPTSAASGIASPLASSASSASSAAPSPSVVGSPAATAYPLPPIGRVRTFRCATLLAAKTLSSITKWSSAPLTFPPGTGAPKLPKGQTDCSYVSSKTTAIKGGLTLEEFTITITLLTGAARAQFDQTWEIYQASPLVDQVSDVGDAARWQAAAFTLAGLKGSTAFTVQVSPFPLDAFSAAAVERVAAAIGRAIAPHL